jgi:hypothetical protein
MCGVDQRRGRRPAGNCRPCARRSCHIARRGVRDRCVTTTAGRTRSVPPCSAP